MYEKLDEFIEENPDEMLVTGGWDNDKIAELENQVDLSFRDEFKEFIRKYGLLMGYGVEIAACGRTGNSRVVESTIRFRELGLDKKYLVLDGDGELAYCLDNETGKIVNWGSDNGEVYSEADDMESFILAQLEDGKENW